MYKLILTDVDGTLIHSDWTIGEKTKEALQRADRMGLRVVISTGRFLKGVDFLGTELGIKPIYSTINGAMIKDGEDYLFVDPISRDAYERAARVAQGSVRCLMAFGENRYCINSDDYFFDLQARFFNLEGIRMDLTDYDAVEKALGSPVLKLLVKDKESEPVDIMFNKLSESGIGDVATLVKSGTSILEVLAKGTSKGKSVTVLSEHFGIPKEEIIAFGDFDNDIDMLKEAGLGIGMANGSKALLEVADYITLSNDEDGIATALEKFVFEGDRNESN
ncbi:MAG: Cof-type HAD-IIB family hydrolase [Sphaerochaetaceae bacterium]|nr:Cof-type HAD-IIB family hydrolase [Sphaerochaetaceae bacterium]